MTDPIRRPGWSRLRQYTGARIALGRVGASLPTEEVLRFQLAHAQARDAVYSVLETARLQEELSERGFGAYPLHSVATDRRHYLLRPDLGRQLDSASQTALKGIASDFAVSFVLADGLSATAVNRHAVPLLDAVLPGLIQTGWTIAPFTLVEQGRVAIGDHIAALVGATLTVVLIGERPGLSSPDSLGVYLTYRPNPGVTTDAERNCLSNIRPEGMSYAVAAAKLLYLLTEAHRCQRTGIGLKDETGLLSE